MQAVDDRNRRRAELLEEKVQLDADIAAIRTQLDKARVRRRTEGIYSDPDWWRRANDALRWKGVRSQEIQRELSGLRSDGRQDAEVRMSRSDVSPKARLAVLFQVALAADAFLYSTEEEEDSAGDRLEDALKELERVSPGWRDH